MARGRAGRVAPQRSASRIPVTTILKAAAARSAPVRAGFLMLLLALAPLAGAQEVGGPAPPPADTGYAGGPVVIPLYGHIYDLLQPVPINTQPMPADYDLARGFGSPSVGGVGPLETPHSLRFYSSPGLVEYNLTEDGLPRHHPERGISYDVLLDTSKPILGYWWMSVKPLDVPQVGAQDGPEAGALPSLTVRMTMRVGDDIGADLDAGEILAQGQTTLGPERWAVNGEPVEFVVDLGTPKVDRIPGDEAFNVLVEWFNAETPTGEQIVQRDWVLHTGLAYPNRVEVTAMNPLALYSVKPTPLGEDKMTIHALLNSPLGNYDVDVATIQLQVEGPTTPRAIAAPVVVQRSFGHNQHAEPVEVTWSWDYRAEAAAPGTYKVTVTAQNLQRTATVTKSATFVIPDEGRAVGYDDTGAVVAADGDAAPAQTPLPAALAVAALLLALLVRRR